MHEFKHPKYYTELRKRNKEEARAQLKVPSSNLDQAISDECATAPRERSPGPGPKRQATSVKPQAASTHPDLLPEHGPEYYAPRRRRKR